MDSEPAIMSESSSDTEPDLEDELCQIQPLPAPVSPVLTVRPIRFRPSDFWTVFGCARIPPNDFAGDASAAGGPVVSSWFGDTHAGGAGILG